MLRSMRLDDPIAHQHFSQFNQAALIFNEQLQQQRDNQAERVRADLAADTFFLGQLRDRRINAHNAEYHLSTSSLIGATPGTYLTEMQTLICVPRQDLLFLSRFSVVAIYPGHKSSLSTATIRDFFTPRITNPIKVLELTKQHPLALLKTTYPDVDYVTGFKKPSHFFTVVPECVTYLPELTAVYQKETSFQGIDCFETSHRLCFYETYELPLFAE